MELVATILDGGGALALALVVWYELRAFRKAMVESVGNIRSKQDIILERQKTIADHVVDNDKQLQLKLLEAARGNSTSHS